MCSGKQKQMLSVICDAAAQQTANKKIVFGNFSSKYSSSFTDDWSSSQICKINKPHIRIIRFQWKTLKEIKKTFSSFFVSAFKKCILFTKQKAPLISLVFFPVFFFRFKKNAFYNAKKKLLEYSRSFPVFFCVCVQKMHSTMQKLLKNIRGLRN